MSLRLIIEHAGHPQPRREIVHMGGDLSIGRGADCDWVLEDPEMFVSRRHCVVSVRDGRYLVTDASRGGLFVDGADRALGAGNSAPLDHGTRLRLGDIVLRVEIEGGKSAAAPVSHLSRAVGGDDFFARPVTAPAAAPRPTGLPEPFETGRPAAAGAAAPPPRPAGPPAFDDPFTLDPVRGPVPAPPAAPAPRPAVDDFWGSPPAPAQPAARAPEPTPGFDNLFAPGPAPAPAAPVADDWFSLPAVAAAPAPPPPPAPPPAPQPAPAPAPEPALAPVAAPDPASDPAPDSGLFAAFLRGAGIDPADARLTGTAAEMEELGRRFRHLGEGLILMLRARAREKGSARLAQTVIGASDVNPLKFLPSTEEALAALIAPRGKGYLAPDDAILAAFRDLSDHQMRSWLAIQSALRRMIDRFDPAAFEGEVDQAGLMKALLAGGRGARLWQLYTERYRDIAKSAEDRFLGEVGADFREAYETKGRSQND